MSLLGFQGLWGWCEFYPVALKQLMPDIAF
jgi:hypothetical protein